MKTKFRSERGAVATIVAALVSLGVVMGFLALSVDVGQMMMQKRQLQNGADATAMYLARNCANGSCDVTTSSSTSTSLNDANSSSASNALQTRCFYQVTTSSVSDSNCPPTATTTGTFADCGPFPPTVSSVLPFVQVATRAKSAAAGGLRNWIAPIIGQSADTSVGACGRAAWGVAGSYSGTVPFAISTCEWQSYTGSDSEKGLPATVVAPPNGTSPGYGGPGQPAWPAPYAGWPNQPGHELYVMSHDTGGDNCSFKGKDTNGGFGWLTTGSSCDVTISSVNNVDYWALIQTGNSVPSTCTSVLPTFLETVIDIPVFDCLVVNNSGTPTGGIGSYNCDAGTTSGGGSKTYYHLAGYAKFYLSGYHFSSMSGGSAVPPNTPPCSSASPQLNAPWTGESGRCLSGWFVSGTLQAPTIVPPSSIGGGNFGAVAVLPAG